MRLLLEIDKKNYIENGTVCRRPSVRGVIITDGKIAMVHGKRQGYYKFPGGGMDEGESHPETLIREVREEAGLVVIPDTVREFGYVHRVQKGRIEDVFIQDNYYYFCEVESERLEQELDDYEAVEEFSLEYVTVDEAIRQNELALKTTLVGDEFYTVMIEREVAVLRIMKEELDNLSK